MLYREPHCFVSSSEGIEDYIEHAKSFEVFESDYYGTGKTVNPQWGMIVVDHEWRFEVNNESDRN